MTDKSNVRLTVSFNDPNSDEEERDREAKNLLKQIKQKDEVEIAGSVSDPNPPADGKGGGFLVGVVTAVINPANLKTFSSFLLDRLGNKSIELEVEANGKKLKVKASSREELEAAIQEAQKFISI